MERLNLKDLPDLSIYTRISPQGQVTVPASIRKALSLSPGDILAWLLQVKEAALPEIRVKPLPQSWASYTRGLGKKLFSKVGGGEKYLKKERVTWD